MENDPWKEQRRFTLHHFRNLGISRQSHERIIHEEVIELIKEIQDTQGGINLQVQCKNDVA